MSALLSAGGAPRPGTEAAAPSTLDAFTQLRELLLGDEIADLAQLQARVSAYHPSAEELAPVIASALDLSRKQQPSALAQATWPLVAQGLERSLKDNPQRVVDILFPIIGPLIRKAIAESLKDFAESLNQVLEHSFSPRYLRWRFQAWRSGVAFSEIVMRNTLLYSVEQVFLIQRASGLLIHHVQRERAQGADSDAVSAMLNAIQDFVRDSFADASDGQLAEIEVGEFQVQVQHGPAAMLALAVRGVPRVALKQRARETLEQIHAQHSAALYEYRGDGEALAGVDAQLRALLAQEQRAPAKTASALRPGSVLLILALIALLGSAVWLFYQRHQQSVLLADLMQQPGWVVAQRDGNHVTVLRDPDAAPLPDRSRLHGLQLNERPIRSLDPSMVLIRVRRTLKLPASVATRFDAGRLILSGTLEREVDAGFRRSALAIDGVEALDLTALISPDPLREFQRTQQQLAALHVQFIDGITMAADAELIIDAVVQALEAVRAPRFRLAPLQLQGLTDGTGIESKNDALALQRAALVRDALVARGISPTRLILTRTLSETSARPDPLRRRVLFTLLPPPALE